MKLKFEIEKLKISKIITLSNDQIFIQKLENVNQIKRIEKEIKNEIENIKKIMKII